MCMKGNDSLRVPLVDEHSGCFTKDMHGMDYISGQEAYLEEVDTCPKGKHSCTNSLSDCASPTAT
eukprot:6126849-Amphidinium_carterae.1